MKDGHFNKCKDCAKSDALKKYDSDMRQPKQTELAPDSKVIDEFIDYFNTYYRQLNGANHRHITIELVRRKSRAQSLVMVRMFISYYLYYYCCWRVALIGYWLNRDHTTIVHALQSFRDMQSVKDPYFMEHYEQLKDLFATPEDVPVNLFLGQFSQSTEGYQNTLAVRYAKENEMKRQLRDAKKMLDKYIKKARNLQKQLAHE
jgi:hypothetical protein